MSDRGGFPGRPGVPALPPSGVPSLPPGLLAPQPGLEGATPPAPAPAAAAPVTTVEAPESPVAPASPRPPVTEARPRRAAPSLPPTFSGRPATPGVRLGAFSIDVVVVSLISVIVFLATASPVFAALAAVELAIALWVVESRTGVTVGNAILRIRTAREEGPFSPGVGRGFVRWFLTGAGFLVGMVGAWAVVASSAWDASGLRRTWADRAARTVVVAVPRRVRVAEEHAVRSDAVVLQAPHLVSTSARGAAIDDDAESVSFTGAPGSTPISTEAAAVRGAITEAPGRRAAEPSAPEQAPVAPAQAAAAPQGRRAAGVPVAADQAAPPAEMAVGAERGALLLIFDTGQREQLPTPVAVNLGRNPSATEQSDRLITVRDPESTVSKTHLRLEHSRGRTWVTDNGSTNGTEIRSDDGDSAPLLPGNRVLLDEGDRVRIGNRTFTVSLLMAHDDAGGERAS